MTRMTISDFSMRKQEDIAAADNWGCFNKNGGQRGLQSVSITGRGNVIGIRKLNMFKTSTAPARHVERRGQHQALPPLIITCFD